MRSSIPRCRIVELPGVHALRHHLRSLSWIALLAMLAVAVLPTLAHARAHVLGQGPGGLGDICTQQGPRQVGVELGVPSTEAVNPTDGSAFATHLQHCPLCALALDAAWLPPTGPAAWPRTPGAVVPPAAFLHAPRTLHAWRTAQPRGPPAAA